MFYGKQPHASVEEVDPEVEKLANFRIDVPEFERTIWTDPRVSQQLTLPQKAMATGLLSGAAQTTGQPNTRWVTPWDMARMTAGMGSGYISGAIVGKVLGALTGMPTDVQDQLKERGVWAGAVANTLPLAFRG